MEDNGDKKLIRQRFRSSRAYSVSVSETGTCWQKLSRWTKRERLLILSLALLDFCGFACLSVMGPFFPTEAAKKGVSQHVTGLIFSCYAITAFIFAPIWGKVVPRIGAKAVLMIGGTAAGGACIVFGLLYMIEDYTSFVVSCFLVRIIEALGFAAFNTAIFTSVAKIFPDTMGSIMALLEIMIGAGLAIGPVIGSGMFVLGGYSGPFMFLGIGLLLVVVGLYFVAPSSQEMKEEEEEVNDEVEGARLPIWRLAGSFQAMLVCLTVFTNALGIAYLIPILSLHVAEIGIGEDKAGLMFMCHLGMYAIAAPFSGHLSDKIPTHRFLVIGVGLFIISLGFFIIGPLILISPFVTNSLSVNIIGLLVIGFGSALALVPTFQALIKAAIKSGCPDTLATYALTGGLWNSVCALGDAVGPATASTLTEFYGFPIATSVCAAFTFVVSIVVMGDYVVRSRRPSVIERVNKDLALSKEEVQKLLPEPFDETP